MRSNYLSLVRRIGKNRAIVAIARILLETKYSMLTKGTELIDKIDSRTERKMKSMSKRANLAKEVIRNTDINGAMKLIKPCRLQGSTKYLFHRRGTAGTEATPVALQLN